MGYNTLMSDEQKQPEAYIPVESENITGAAADLDQTVKWTASEFVAHDKTAAWYIGVFAAGLVIGALLYLITRDAVTAGVVIVAAIVLAVYGSHRPRELPYELSIHGIQVDAKFYPFEDYRSFSVISEGAFSSIMLMPLKRFATSLTVYYAPEDEERIVGLLGVVLPFEPRQPDAVDRLMKKIRF